MCRLFPKSLDPVHTSRLSILGSHICVHAFHRPQFNCHVRPLIWHHFLTSLSAHRRWLWASRGCPTISGSRLCGAAAGRWWIVSARICRPSLAGRLLVASRHYFISRPFRFWNFRPHHLARGSQRWNNDTSDNRDLRTGGLSCPRSVRELWAHATGPSLRLHQNCFLRRHHICDSALVGFVSAWHCDIRMGHSRDNHYPRRNDPDSCHHDCGQVRDLLEPYRPCFCQCKSANSDRSYRPASANKGVGLEKLSESEGRSWETTFARKFIESRVGRCKPISYCEISGEVAWYGWSKKIGPVRLVVD